MQPSITRPAPRRRWLAGALIVLLVVVVVIAGLRWWAGRKAPPLIASAVTVAPGVHQLGGLGPSAAYAVETADGLVLIDTSLESDARGLKDELARLGLDWKTVRAILITHVHGDHCGGAEYLRKETGAKVYAGKGDAPVLRAGGPRDAFFSTFYMPNHSPHPTTVDVELGGGETFTFGGVRFKALATPGHTPGSICYLMDRDGTTALFSGDVIMRLGGPHAVGTYAAYLPPRYRGDARTYLETLRRLRSMPVPDLVLPGHPRWDHPESPSLSQAEWEEMLDKATRDMQTLLARFQADGADFLDGEPKRLLPDLYYLGDYRGSAVYAFFAASKLFLVDAPGGPGLLEFVKARLKGLGAEPADPAAVLLTSCGEAETAGLKELIEKCRTQVVAAPEGLAAARALCPPGATVLSAEDLPKRGWFAATPIPLRGRGVAPIAYVLPWAKKSVLFSGRIPILFDHDSVERLSADLDGSRDRVVDYLTSIYRLDPLKPDLWLPEVPSDGQNANLYDTQWQDIIGANYRLGDSKMPRRPAAASR